MISLITGFIGLLSFALPLSIALPTALLPPGFNHFKGFTIKSSDCCKQGGTIWLKRMQNCSQKTLFQSKLAFNHDLFAIAALQVVVSFAGERRRGTGTVWTPVTELPMKSPTKTDKIRYRTQNISQLTYWPNNIERHITLAGKGLLVKNTLAYRAHSLGTIRTKCFEHDLWFPPGAIIKSV